VADGFSTWVDTTDSFDQFVVDGVAALSGAAAAILRRQSSADSTSAVVQANEANIRALVEIAKQRETRAQTTPNASVEANGKLNAAGSSPDEGLTQTEQTPSSEPDQAPPSAATPTERICESVPASSEQVFGPVVVEVRVEKGPVSCSEARHVARTYFSGKADFVSGESNATSYFTVSDGWSGSGRSESWYFGNERLKARIGGSFRYVCGERTQSRPC
jgi:hypothetical protein